MNIDKRIIEKEVDKAISNINNEIINLNNFKNEVIENELKLARQGFLIVNKELRSFLKNLRKFNNEFK